MCLNRHNGNSYTAKILILNPGPGMSNTLYSSLIITCSNIRQCVQHSKEKVDQNLNSQQKAFYILTIWRVEAISFLSNHCNSFENRVNVDEMYGYPIFKSVRLTWQGIRITISVMGAMVTHPIVNIFEENCPCLDETWLYILLKHDTCLPRHKQPHSQLGYVTWKEMSWSGKFGNED